MAHRLFIIVFEEYLKMDCCENNSNKYAVISDVHGNYHAMKRVLKLIKGERAENVIFLGDGVGYGSFPNECYYELRRVSKIYLMGNHEAMLLNSNQRMSDLCVQSFRWTIEHINKDIIEDFSKLPLNYSIDEIGFYHAAPNSTLLYWDYLKDKDDIVESFKNFERICFYGHTHRPRITILGDKLIDKYVNHTIEFEIDIFKDRCYINPGSVGQQRDGHTDLSFAIFEQKCNKVKIKIVRHRYNSFAAYMSIRFGGCGIGNANYLIREKWRKRAYEHLGNWCSRIYRKSSV